MSTHVERTWNCLRFKFLFYSKQIGTYPLPWGRIKTIIHSVCVHRLYLAAMKWRKGFTRSWVIYTSVSASQTNSWSWVIDFKARVSDHQSWGRMLHKFGRGKRQWRVTPVQILTLHSPPTAFSTCLRNSYILANTLDPNDGMSLPGENTYQMSVSHKQCVVPTVPLTTIWSKCILKLNLHVTSA